jgi:hypothetical protein
MAPNVGIERWKMAGSCSWTKGTLGCCKGELHSWASSANLDARLKGTHHLQGDELIGD